MKEKLLKMTVTEPKPKPTKIVKRDTFPVLDFTPIKNLKIEIHIVEFDGKNRIAAQLEWKKTNVALDLVDNYLENTPEGARPLIEEVKIGGPCIAYYEDDGGCYRARIEEKINDDKYKVFFVDYGGFGEVDANKLYLCPADIVDYEEGITSCILTDFTGNESPEELQLVKEKIQGVKDFLARIDNVVDDDFGYKKIVYLTLFDAQKGENVTLKESLLNQDKTEISSTASPTSPVQQDIKVVETPTKDINNKSFEISTTTNTSIISQTEISQKDNEEKELVNGDSKVAQEIILEAKKELQQQQNENLEEMKAPSIITPSFVPLVSPVGGGEDACDGYTTTARTSVIHPSSAVPVSVIEQNEQVKISTLDKECTFKEVEESKEGIPSTDEKDQQLQMKALEPNENGEILQEKLQKAQLLLEKKCEELEHKDQAIAKSLTEPNEPSQQLLIKEIEIPVKAEQLQIQEKKLQIKEKEVDEKARDLQIKQKEVHAQAQDLQIKQKEIADKAQQLQELNESSRDLQKELNDKAQKLHNVEKELNNKTQNLLAQQEKVDQKTQELVLKEQSLDTREKEVCEKLSNLVDREKKMEQIVEELAARESKLEKEFEQLAIREDKLEQEEALLLIRLADVEQEHRMETANMSKNFQEQLKRNEEQLKRNEEVLNSRVNELGSEFEKAKASIQELTNIKNKLESDLNELLARSEEHHGDEENELEPSKSRACSMSPSSNTPYFYDDQGQSSYYARIEEKDDVILQLTELIGKTVKSSHNETAMLREEIKKLKQMKNLSFRKSTPLSTHS